MTDPVNPFILPALAEDEVTYTASRLKPLQASQHIKSQPG